MKRLFAFAVLLSSCAAPAILGGPTPQTTQHRCEDGTYCPNGWGCPPLAGGPCQGAQDEEPNWGGENMGAKHAPADAGDAALR